MTVCYVPSIVPDSRKTIMNKIVLLSTFKKHKVKYEKDI